jgi:hypothetical protein
MSISKYEKERRERIKDIQVLSWFGKCHCGKIIPYGQISCPGHGRYSRYFYKNNKLFQLSNCAICQSTTTYIYNNVKQWRHDEVGNLICKRCYDRRWRNKNPEYCKVYQMLMQPTGLKSMATNATNIVLVHGFWADGSSWSKVIPILENAGHKVIAVQLPLHSLADDVATVKRAIDLVGRPTILVGHSYGGFVITILIIVTVV